ncbi:unnamed protein product [Cunninghamella echinulata]
MNGVFIGFNNGCIYFLSQNESLNDLVLVSQLQFESVMLIHFCNLINTEASTTNTHNTFILIGSGGTVQVYFKTTLNSQNIVYFKEFTIPSSIVSITAFKGTPAILISCKNDLLYYIEFKLQSDLSNKSEIILSLTQLQAPKNICKIQSIKKEQNVILYQILDRDGHMSTYELNLLDTPITVNQSCDELKSAINDILTQLSEQESRQNNLNAYHEKLNNRLISMNKTLYAIQNMSLKRDSSGSISDDFQFNIKPFVRTEPLTGEYQLFLHIELKAKIGLNWNEWSLNIDISHQRSLLQEYNSSVLNKSESVNGTTFILPLYDFETTEESSVIQIWERDIKIDPVNTPLPLDIIISLVMSVDTPTITEDNLLNLEYLPIGKNAQNNDVNFTVSFMNINVLHFTIPLSTINIKQLKQKGIKYMSNKIRSKRQKSIKSETIRLMENIFDNSHTTIHLCFVSQPENHDGLYRTILSVLLSEGKSSEDITKIIDDAEHAFFSLATDPLDIITITLIKVPKDTDKKLYVDLQIKSTNPLVQLKVEAALLSILQNYITDENDKAIIEDTKSFYQELQNFEMSLNVLESSFQDISDLNNSNIWEKLKTTLGFLQRTQDHIRFTIHQFNN